MERGRIWGPRERQQKQSGVEVQQWWRTKTFPGTDLWRYVSECTIVIFYFSTLTCLLLSLQLSHNVKNVVLGPIHSQNRLSLTLKDSSVVILERLPITVAKKLKEYLEMIKQGKQTGVFKYVVQISFICVGFFFLLFSFRCWKKKNFFTTIYLFI